MKKNKIVEFAKELANNLSPSTGFERKIMELVYE